MKEFLNVWLHFLPFYITEEKKDGFPLPFPSYAKKLLISLCKEVPFQVKCISCSQLLRSHMELTAHFRFVGSGCLYNANTHVLISDVLV